MIQFARRSLLNDRTARPEGQTRQRRTDTNGWRIDWPLKTPVQVPFVDNLPAATPWTPGKRGSWEDSPGLNVNRKHAFLTCFIGEKDDGTRKWLGCLKWEASRKGENDLTLTPDPHTPQWSCGKPTEPFAAADDAFDL